MKGLKNNTLQGVFEWFCNSIAGVYDEREARSVGQIVFEELYAITPVMYAMDKSRRMTESDIINLYRVIKKLNIGIPVQHITGKGYFRDLVLKVNGDVLIPRSETEELVQWIVEDFANAKHPVPLTIWDIGTGSGAIAVSLAAEMNNAEVWASDVSEEALIIAKENSLANGQQVRFFHHDILGDALPDEKFDVIVSNPPYIRLSEKPLMRNNVLDHEPHTALFVPDEDPLLFYRAIGQAGMKLLSPGGKVYLEINEALGLETCQLYESLGYMQVEVRKDLPGKDRFVKASLPV
ncbi:MAG: peptide chain release factor N(5)-glutamine methyltransferase [Bacteroidetes bacterium]|nr:MAG: peptide chain release factor N(5)-glutamine methyltransferase [Bacteroidota bacterium]